MISETKIDSDEKPVGGTRELTFVSLQTLRSDLDTYALNIEGRLHRTWFLQPLRPGTRYLDTTSMDMGSMVSSCLGAVRVVKGWPILSVRSFLVSVLCLSVTD